ncbi:MAG TPA: STAS domain-containing protein [Polyangiaceae bacterium]|jgi:anti-sigma B factor antagonist|nr:MAG: Anti-sigma-B factor antagonist [Deltaproteobacteria bacterium ADurb.Bin207]HNS97948.1 STAS domain-containing protein [Polyangiaceae bacterium]HNZ25139.1 STAS domain-containing protein [Polyangiaceae bacterium]HOD24142.1 STAS domain-containing protein [Polyangiaceae bacterium]HOE51336.1 STAS domain-containing protein [Polyangiaceae bacterium]
MMFSKTVEGDAIRIEISGQLDSMTAPELRPSFEALLQENPKRIVLDLSGLRLIDSSGVGAIVSLFKQVRAAGGAFEVVGVQGQPRSIFQVLRLDRVFNIA